MLAQSCKIVGTVTHFLAEESKITFVSSEPLLLSTNYIVDIGHFFLGIFKQACQTTLNVSQVACLLWKTLNSGGKVCPALPL